MGVINNGWEIFSDLVCNQLTEKVAIMLKKYGGADLFIVCGDGGVGKSSFIKSVTSEAVFVGSTLESGTKATALVPAVIDDKRCLFLDMPGFNTRDFDDWDIFFRLMTAMAVIQKYVVFRGVLFVDSFQNNRITDSAEKILTWLALFCGLDYMPNVTIVTTKWDGLDADGIEEKLSLVQKWKDSLLEPLIRHGASVYYHGLVGEAGSYRTLHINKAAEQRKLLARNYIRAHYQEPTSLKLQIYEEIKNGATIDTTRAGRWLKYGNASSSSDSDSARSSPEPSQPGFWDGFSWDKAKPWAKLLLKATRFYMSTASGGGPPMQEFSFSGPFGEMDSDDDDYISFISPMPESTTSNDSCQIL